MGSAAFHWATDRRDVDTVYLGCYRTARLRALGGWDADGAAVGRRGPRAQPPPAPRRWPHRVRPVDPELVLPARHAPRALAPVPQLRRRQGVDAGEAPLAADAAPARAGGARRGQRRRRSVLALDAAPRRGISCRPRHGPRRVAVAGARMGREPGRRRAAARSRRSRSATWRTASGFWSGVGRVRARARVRPAAGGCAMSAARAVERVVTTSSDRVSSSVCGSWARVPSIRAARHAPLDARRRSSDAGAPRVLVLSPRDWAVHVQWEALLGPGARRRGADVRFATCGGGLETCDRVNVHEGPPPPCHTCSRYTEYRARIARSARRARSRPTTPPATGPSSTP